MTTVLAVDPGLKTGFAVYDGSELVHANQLPHDEFAEELRSFYHDTYDDRHLTYDVIVCEDYRVTPQTLKKTWQPWSLYQIGLLRYMAGWMGSDFVLQTAAQGKSFSTDTKLKKMEWYVPTVGGHRNDAVRHLLLYLVQHTDDINLQDLM